MSVVCCCGARRLFNRLTRWPRLSTAVPQPLSLLPPYLSALSMVHSPHFSAPLGLSLLRPIRPASSSAATSQSGGAEQSGWKEAESDSGAQHSSQRGTRVRRRLTEEEMYDRELAALMARRGQRQRSESEQAAQAAADVDEAAADEDVSGDLPEVVEWFELDYGDWSADEDIVRLRQAQLSDGGRADNGGSSLHHIHMHRIIRVKEAVRDILPDVLRSRSSPRLDFTSLPLLVTRVRVSSDVQWVSVEWTLVPLRADSSLCRLPASMSGLSLHAVLELIASQLAACIAPLRSALGSRLTLRYVPNVRFVYDGEEWRKRRRDRRRQREVEERLSGSSNGSGGSQRQQGEELVEAEVGFHRFNPFVSAPPGPPPAVGAQKRSSGGAGGIVSEQRPSRESRRSRQQREQRRALDEMKRTGVVNGQQRYARPVQLQQQQQQQAARSRPRHIKRDEQWIQKQQRALWESEH